jgi:16S rRNA (guanine966-N2)-methyltransferase
VSIKILGGFARGQILQVPKGDLIRPTSVLLKRRVFDFFQEMNDIIFLDLCAGSGAMGFEAWSRGSSLVILNEMNRHVAKSLQENRENLLLKNHHKTIGELECIGTNAVQFIKLFKSRYENFDNDRQENTVIFLDPPYSEKNIYLEIVEFLKSENWFKGQLWIESDKHKGIPFPDWQKMGLAQNKLFEQGDSYIFITNFPQNSNL